MSAEKKRVQRDAAEKQHDRRRAAAPRREQGVDDRERAERSGEAGERHRRDAEQREIGVEGDGEHRAERAPAETPSVSGEASGLRSSAWNTTPAERQALPTSAAASTRGSRATKKICASTLSAKGIEPVEDARAG